MAATGDDCYFFYYSSCNKGSSCPFRHCAEALGSEVTCLNWKQGFCYRPSCAFRHMDITKNRSEILCYWESQPVGCQKPHCPFKHVKKSTTDGTAASASVSLINKLPTITGPVTKALPPVVVSHPAPAVQSVVPSVQPPIQPFTQPAVQASLDRKNSLDMPTVKPVVVTPLDSEDDDSLGTMSTDGSPAKRLIVSPLRSSNRPSIKERLDLKQSIPSLDTAVPIHAPDTTRPVRVLEIAKANKIAAAKPMSLGIKTLAEIRREKNAERGHDDENWDVEEKERETDMEPDVDDSLEDDQHGVFPPLRRIISVSSRSMNASEGKEKMTKSLDHEALDQRGKKKQSGAESLTEMQQEVCIKKLGRSQEGGVSGRSLEGGDWETRNMKKRIKVSEAYHPSEPGGEEHKKKVIRRVVVGDGAGPGTQADSSSLLSSGSKSHVALKKEELVQRLGKRAAADDKDDEPCVTASSQRRGVAERLGGTVRDGGGDARVDNNKNSAGMAEQREGLARRLGTITRTVGLTKELEDSSQNGAASKLTGRLSRRLGQVACRDTGGEAGGKASGEEIRVKSLAEIKREKLLQRLGKPVDDSSDEVASDSEKTASVQEEEKEEEEQCDTESKMSSGNIRIKTLDEIRLEKRSRQRSPTSAEPTPDTERETEGRAVKKGIQSSQERRTRKRTELALYKPPGAVRGDVGRERQGSGVGMRRSSELAREKKAERGQGEGERAVKLRRLNLAQSVQSANQGTESILSLIKQRKDRPAEDSSSVKVKSLAEIRAERQQQGELGGDSPPDPEQMPGASPGGEAGLEPRMEEEKRKERRAKIWSRTAIRTDRLEKPAATAKGKEDEGKSLDQLRRERRARLWNVSSSGDAGAPSVDSQQGKLTSQPAPEIKIKTLAEIRREKRLREQQQEPRIGADLAGPLKEGKGRDEREADCVPHGGSLSTPSSSGGKAEMKQASVLMAETGHPSHMADDWKAEESLPSTDAVCEYPRNPSKKWRREAPLARQARDRVEACDETVPADEGVSSADAGVLSAGEENVASQSDMSKAPRSFEDITDSVSTTEGSRHEEISAVSKLNNDSTLSELSLHTNLASTSVEENLGGQPRPAAQRLTSITDEDDLHSFLLDHDTNDCDGKSTVALATNEEDDDLLNELDDFLNS